MTILPHSRTKDIKKAQKERLLFKELSALFLQLTQEDSRLQGLWITKVALSPDKGLCYVFLFSADGKSKVESLLEILKLYKPSIRKAIAQSIAARYTPDIRFQYDDQYEKVEHINALIDRVKTE
jgi:ribosome-binding factor A